MKQLTLVLFLAVAGISCGGGGESTPKKAASPKSEPVKIVQFYASAATVPRGEQALLCYGVENARAVRINPPVESLHPAVNRCISVTPSRTTTYTLTAEAEDGSTATKSVTLEVGKGLPAAEKTGGPAIVSFNTEKKPGLTLLCYQVANAESVEITPNVLPRSTVFRGCVGVAPTSPTTYTITAYGPHGSKRRTLVVKPE